MNLFPRLLKETGHSKPAIILSISLGLMAGILSILQAQQVSRLISQVFLQGKNLASVSGMVIAILVIIVLRSGLFWGGEVSAGAAAHRIKQGLRQRLYAHIMDLGPSHLRGEAGESQVRTGELVNLATEGVDALETFYSQYLPQIALAALVPLAILVFVFPSDLLSGVVLLITAPLLPLFMVLIGSVAKTLTRKQWRGLSRMSAYFLDALQGLTTLKSLGRSRDQVEVIKKVSEHYRQSTMDVLKVTFLSALVLELITTLSTAVVAVEIGVRLLYGKMAFEQAFFVLLLAPEFYLPLRLLGTRFHAGMAGIEAANRIFELLDLPTKQGPQVTGDRDRTPSEDVTTLSIVFKDVSYTYSNNRPALQGISFTIPPGKITALVGKSGAGKTTLTWLLLRFLHPSKGEIFINDRQLSEIPVAQWRENLAWVPQNPFLFNDTIAANIKLAKPNATEAAIVQAARLAHADGFIGQLPHGYSTQIGEHGLRLSAGQAQRIALARAFLKDAPFLILDEATSHLDPDTDALLQESIARLSLGRTVLVIAHNRSTLAKADQVIRLNHGRVEPSQEIETSTSPERGSVKDFAVRTALQNIPKNQHTSEEKDHPEAMAPSKHSIVLRLIKLLTPYTGRILLSICLGFATILSSVGLMVTAAFIISAAALHPSIAELQVAIVGVRFFGLSRGVFRYLERLVSHDITFRLLARWRVWFYQALEPLAPARLMQYHSGDLLSRVISDIGTLESFYVRTLAPPLVALLVGIVMIIFLGTFMMELSWALLVFLALAGLGLPWLVFFLSRRLGPQIVRARADLNTLIIDGIQGLPDLLASGVAKSKLEQVNKAGEQLTRLQARFANLSAFQTASNSLLANLCMLTVLVLAVQSVSGGQLPGVLLGVVALAALVSFEALQPLPLAAQNLETNRSAARRLYELVDAEPAISDPDAPLIPPDDARIDVQDLSFHYPSWTVGEFPANLSSFGLENISFSLQPGKHIAIVGPSGAGKTSLINLLQRFWEYHQGSIFWGGNELRLYQQEDFRRHLATISQNTYLFSATIKENLLIARPDATSEELAHAVKAAHLHDLILSLPDGYDTWIGEHGLHLSAGERQRMSIARLLLKNSPLFILDEPTANLDPATERIVLDSIRELSHGRSTISITQRMVDLETMDEILVLQDGHLVEHGSHAELLSKRGLYYRMWELYNQII